MRDYYKYVYELIVRKDTQNKLRDLCDAQLHICKYSKEWEDAHNEIQRMLSIGFDFSASVN